MAIPIPDVPGVEHRFLTLATGVKVHVAEAVAAAVRELATPRR
jgi:hypothetical protein